MTDKYDEIFKVYKNFMESKSQYGVRVVKYNTNTSSYFPLITCVLSDNNDTDECTNDKIEYYEAFYYNYGNWRLSNKGHCRRDECTQHVRGTAYDYSFSH